MRIVPVFLKTLVVGTVVLVIGGAIVRSIVETKREGKKLEEESEILQKMLETDKILVDVVKAQRSLDSEREAFYKANALNIKMGKGPLFKLV